MNSSGNGGKRRKTAGGVVAGFLITAALVSLIWAGFSLSSIADSMESVAASMRSIAHIGGE